MGTLLIGILLVCFVIGVVSAYFEESRGALDTNFTDEEQEEFFSDLEGNE